MCKHVHLQGSSKLRAHKEQEPVPWHKAMHTVTSPSHIKHELQQLDNTNLTENINSYRSKNVPKSGDPLNWHVWHTILQS